MKKVTVVFMAVLLVLVLSFPAFLSAANDFFDSSGKLDVNKMNKASDDAAKNMYENTDKQNEGLLQFTVGLLAMTGGMIVVMVPLLAEMDMPMSAILIAGGGALFAVGIWQIMDGLPKLAYIDQKGNETRLVYEPVMLMSSGDIAHCVGISSQF